MQKEPVLEAVDKTLDVVDENVQTVKRIPRLRLNGTTTKQQITILAFTAITGAAVAGVATYVVMKRRAAKDVSMREAIERVKNAPKTDQPVEPARMVTRPPKTRGK